MNKDSAIINSIMKGTFIFFIGLLISKVLNFLYRLVIVRFLSPSEYGLLNIGLSVVTVVSAFALFGIPQGLTRFVAFYRGKNDNKSINAIIRASLGITLTLSILLTIVLIIFSNKIAIGFFNSNSLSPLIRVLALSLPLSILASNLEIIIMAFQAVKYIVLVRNFIETASKFCFTLLLLLLGIGIMSAAAGYLISLTIAVVLLFYFLQKKIYPLGKSLFNKVSHTRQLLNFSFPQMFSDFMNVSIYSLDTIILGYFMPSFVVGVYNAVTPTVRLIHTIPYAFHCLFYPAICRLYAQNIPIDNIYRTVTKWIFFINLPLTAIIMLFPKEILGILFGQQYVSGNIALIITGGAFLLSSLGYISNNILWMLKKTKLIMINMAISLILNIILNIILIPRFGLNGAAIALAAGYSIGTILSEIEAYYLTRIIPFKKNYLNAFLAAAIASIIVYFISRHISIINIYALIILALVLIIIYCILLLIIPHSIDIEDKDIMTAAYNKLKRSIFG